MASPFDSSPTQASQAVIKVCDMPGPKKTSDDDCPNLSAAVQKPPARWALTHDPSERTVGRSVQSTDKAEKRLPKKDLETRRKQGTSDHTIETLWHSEAWDGEDGRVGECQSGCQMPPVCSTNERIAASSQKTPRPDGSCAGFVSMYQSSRLFGRLFLMTSEMNNGYAIKLMILLTRPGHNFGNEGWPVGCVILHHPPYHIWQSPCSCSCLG